MDGVVVAEAHSLAPELTCPDCATVSRRMHSRYGRRRAEYPVGGRRLVVKPKVRRFFCAAADCGRRTFVEQAIAAWDSGHEENRAAAGPYSAAACLGSPPRWQRSAWRSGCKASTPLWASPGWCR
ncbi:MULTISPECIES: transposase family protein [Streptomyces]|uniref:transposase family protein n=1 Tax=Streptomyces TaxID=1883 RepID=UPI0037BC0C4E